MTEVIPYALAGLYHHYVMRDNTLQRMWRKADQA